MSRNLLVVGLDSDTTVEHAKLVKEHLQEMFPDLQVAVIVGCTALASVSLPTDSRYPEP